MSSKNVESKEEKERLRRWSLGTRLMVWFASSAFALVFTTSAFLYWKLTDSLDTEDDSLLLNKARSLRVLLDQKDADTAALQWEVETEAQQRSENRTFIRILDAEGMEVLSTSGMDRVLPRRLFPPPVEAEEGAVGMTVADSEGAPFRVLSVRMPVASSGEGQYVFEVALDTALEKELIGSYRRSLWLVLCLSLTASCAGGFYIARRGMRPIEQISTKVRGIGSRNLDERIDRRGLPTELDSLAETCNEMLARLERAFSKISQFSSDIAHELRTPMNNLRGEAEVALSKPRTLQEYKDALTSCLEESEQVARLIDGLLFLARAEDPEQQPHRELLDVETEVGAVAEFYEAAATDAGISLERRPGSNLHILANRALIQRVLGNLIENALAHTPAGGSISISAEGAGQEIVLRVTDTGCGIPAEHLPRVLDRFHRVDRARSRNGGGTGLGLAIVQSVVRLHAGTVKVESLPEQGTTVTVVLPRASSIPASA